MNKKAVKFMCRGLRAKYLAWIAKGNTPHLMPLEIMEWGLQQDPPLTIARGTATALLRHLHLAGLIPDREEARQEFNERVVKEAVERRLAEAKAVIKKDEPVKPAEPVSVAKAPGEGPSVAFTVKGVTITIGKREWTFTHTEWRNVMQVMEPWK